MAQRKTDDGRDIISLWPTEGARKTVITSNWADKTTWYYAAEHVLHDTAAVTSSGSVYQLSNSFLVDTGHGKITGEDTLLDSNSVSFLPTVSGTVSGTMTIYTEVNAGTGVGDFTLDYETGAITFSPSIPLESEIKASYHHASSSEFRFGPSPGKKLMIKDVEVQFSTDLVLTDTVFFEAYGYVDVFAPQYLISNGGPYPSGTKISIGKTSYKTMVDYINEANGALPIIPKLGGTGWRGMGADIVVFPWKYQAMTTLNSAAGMEIRIKLENDTPFEGSVATVTFYCLSEDEN